MAYLTQNEIAGGMAGLPGHRVSDEDIILTGPSLFARDPLPAPLAWQRVFRLGILPDVSTKALHAFRQALIEDSPLLIQGSTTSPPALHCVTDWTVEGACGLCWLTTDGDKPDVFTVGQLERLFMDAAWECYKRLGEPGAIRYWLNWFDDAPRGEMRAALLAEIDRAIAERERQVAR
jgi:hypothetical protein